MVSIFAAAKDRYNEVCRRLHTVSASFLSRNALPLMFGIGSAFLYAGIAGIEPAHAQDFNDSEIIGGLCRVLYLVEGSFGATVMAVAGIIAVVAAAMGGYRAALSALVVGIGAYTIRPVVELFFDNEGTFRCATGSAFRLPS